MAALPAERTVAPEAAKAGRAVREIDNAARTDVKGFIFLSDYYGYMPGLGKAWFSSFCAAGIALSALTSCMTGCTSSGSRHPTASETPIRVLLDRAPVTLNPRMSADLNGQRLGELLYGALTIKDAEMRPHPYLAESWKIEEKGTRWVFKIRPGLTDHAGQEITAERLANCFEEYRNGKPRSILMAAFSSIRSIQARPSNSAGAGEIIFELTRPDPYLATNLTLFRYFTTGDPSKPCREPASGDSIVTSGYYRLPSFSFADLNPEHSIDLIPVDLTRTPLQISWTQDDNTKALKLIRGDVDAVSTSLSLSKTRWIEKSYSDRFRVLERPNGVNVSYLAFNLKNPHLKKLAVRKAIALAIDRDDFVRHKLMGFGTPAGTLLSPTLDESVPQDFAYNPKEAEALLDQAGYRRGPDGARLRLRFKTTSIRDGYETALTLQHALHQIGIELTLDIVEPAVFFASIRKGAFDLYTSRWIGVSDASIFHRTLTTGNPDNRGSYSNPEMDSLLEEAMKQTELPRRKEVLAQVQRKVAEDLPFFPLWYWNPAVIIRKDLRGLEASELSLSGSLAPLTRLR
jgi:peptide/nickel transport system substrate-binding protein